MQNLPPWKSTLLHCRDCWIFLSLIEGMDDMSNYPSVKRVRVDSNPGQGIAFNRSKQLTITCSKLLVDPADSHPTISCGPCCPFRNIVLPDGQPYCFSFSKNFLTLSMIVMSTSLLAQVSSPPCGVPEAQWEPLIFSLYPWSVLLMCYMKLLMLRTHSCWGRSSTKETRLQLLISKTPRGSSLHLHSHTRTDKNVVN